MPITAIAETPGSLMRNHAAMRFHAPYDWRAAIVAAITNVLPLNERGYGERRDAIVHATEIAGEMSASVGTAKKNCEQLRLLSRALPTYTFDKYAK